MWRILRQYPDPRILALAGALGVGIFVYLWRVVGQHQLPERYAWLRLIAAGLIVYGLGYVPFFVNPDVDLTTTGVANRIAIAAAVGAALSMVGLLGWATTLLPVRVSGLRLFCLLITLLCASGFVITNTIASFWIAAYQQQRVILSDIESHFATLPSRSTLILDGICPYLGPGIVFEANWDLAGALRILYRESTLRANVVTPNLRMGKKGLSVWLYGEESYYPYDENLLLYNFGNKVVYRLTDAEASQRYFQSFSLDRSGCPPGREGFGVTVF